MGDRCVLQSIATVMIGGTAILGAFVYARTIGRAILVLLLENTFQIVGIRPAKQNILYDLVILLMHFVHGRGAHVCEMNQWPADRLSGRDWPNSLALSVSSYGSASGTPSLHQVWGRHRLPI